MVSKVRMGGFMSFAIKKLSLFACSVVFLGTLANAATINVDIGKEYQRISGFGAASAWAGSITDKNAAFLWDSTSGAGLTLHRIRIAPDGTPPKQVSQKKRVNTASKSGQPHGRPNTP